VSYTNISKRKGAFSPFGGSFFNDLSNQPPFASLYLVAGVVSKPGLVQLFSTLLAAVSHRGSGRTNIGMAFQTRCLLIVW